MRIKIDNHPNALIDDVKLVRIDGVGAAYCGTRANSPICFINRQPQSVRLLVKQKVEKYIGGSVGSVNEPPPVDNVDKGETGDGDSN